MPEFADLIHLIAPEVPGCPDPLIEKMLLDITRTFCDKSTFYRKEIDPVVMVATIAEYALVPPAGYEVTGISRAWVGGAPMFPMVGRPVRKPDGNTPSHYLYPALNTIGIHPIPNALAAGKEVEIEAVLRPTLAATGADDEILARWEQEIVHGVLGRLFSQSKKPWTDLTLSDFHTRQFRKGWSEALLQSLRGNTSYRHTAYPEVV